MDRRKFITSSLGGLLINNLYTHNLQAHSLKTLPIKSMLILDVDNNRIIHSFNDEKNIYPASITKLMTVEIAFVCIEKGILKPDTVLTMTPYSANKEPTKLWLKPGEKIYLKDALKAVAVHSCNDIASLIAETIAGSEEKFVDLMNERAQSFKMNDTIFYNSTGLPEYKKNISTAHDIAIMAHNIMYLHPDKINLFGMPTWNWKGTIYHNSNHLMGYCPGMDFCKTGYIHDSGFNIVASVKINDCRYLCVLTGCRSSLERDGILTQIVKNIKNL